MKYESYLHQYGNTDSLKKEIESIAAKLKIPADWLMILFYSESKVNPKAVNFQKGDDKDAYIRSMYRATGLIQWMPKTTEEYGFTNQAIYLMSFSGQLDLVYRYFKPVAGKMKSFEDLYLYNFFPAAVGKSDSYIMQTSDVSAKTIAAQNFLFDLNKNGAITVGEFKTYIRDKFNIGPSNYIAWPLLAAIIIISYKA